MLAVCLNLLVILWLCWTALIDAGKEVQWRKSGDAITIQCKFSGKQEESLDLRKGLHEEFQVFYTEAASVKKTTGNGYIGRLQTHGEFPNIDILIKNLSPNDTGLYWCMYKKYDIGANEILSTKGDGSVLLVVKEYAEEKHVRKDEVKECGPSNQNLIMVCVVIIGAVLLLVITVFLIWIILKNRSRNTAEKPRRVATNDVYEEMRGTLRS